MPNMMIEMLIYLGMLAIIAHISNPRGVYAEWIQEFFEEPAGRMIALVGLYVVARWHVLLGVVLAIGVAMVLVDVLVSSKILRVVQQDGMEDAEGGEMEDEGDVDIEGFEDGEDADVESVEDEGEGEGEGEGGNETFENTKLLAAENQAFADTLREFLKKNGDQIMKTNGARGKMDSLMTNQFGLVENMKAQIEKYGGFGGPRK